MQSLSNFLVGCVCAIVAAPPGWAQTETRDAVYAYSGPDRAARLMAGAKTEGVVVVYTSLAPTESLPLAQAFEKKTGVKVELWRAISEKVVQRAVAEARARRFAVDVVETNGPEMEIMAREQLFAAFHSPHLVDIPERVMPAHRLWIPDRMNFFVVGYNTAQVRRDELPNDYRGFLDPKWQGRIGLEATDAEWMATLIKRWGAEEGRAYFRRLAEMKPDVRKGHVLLAELIASGEIAVGLTVYESNAESLKRKGAPIDWVPVAPLVARPQGIAVARNAPHPHAALAFVDYVLSVEGQELLRSMGRAPASTRAQSHMSRLEYTTVEAATALDEQGQWNELWDSLFMRK